MKESNPGRASTHCHTQWSAVLACCGRSDTHSFTNTVYTTLIHPTNMFLLHSGRSRVKGFFLPQLDTSWLRFMGDEVEEEDVENTSPIWNVSFERSKMSNK